MLINLTKDIILKDASYTEFFDCIYDLLENENVKKMKNFKQHANTSCFKHCLQVAYYTYIACKKLNLDYRSATRGAMLHDFFLYDWHNYIRPDKKWKNQHAFAHPRIALKNACEVFHLNELEKDVIRKHMWPLTISLPHYKETIIVTFADKYSATRETLLYFRDILHSKKIYRYAYVFLSLLIFRII